jgi:Winged helix-turn helix
MRGIVMSSLTRDKEGTMPVPRAPQVSLADDEQRHLASIVRAHSTPQALSFRCQVILRAAAADRPSNLQVAQELECDRHTVGRWRSRYLAHGLRGLQDVPRPGRPRRFSPLATSGCDGDGHA